MCFYINVNFPLGRYWRTAMTVSLKSRQNKGLWSSQLKTVQHFHFLKNQTTEETKFANRNSISIWGITSSFEETEKHGYRDSGHRLILPILGSCKGRSLTARKSLGCLLLPVISCNWLLNPGHFHLQTNSQVFQTNIDGLLNLNFKWKKYLPVMSSHTFYLDFQMLA